MTQDLRGQVEDQRRRSWRQSKSIFDLRQDCRWKCEGAAAEDFPRAGGRGTEVTQGYLYWVSGI